MSPMRSGIKNRNRRKPMSEINMVPFIDIMMVLLVAFMITAPMMTQGVKVELPKTSSDNIALPEDKEVLLSLLKQMAVIIWTLDLTMKKRLLFRP